MSEAGRVVEQREVWLYMLGTHTVLPDSVWRRQTIKGKLTNQKGEFTRPRIYTVQYIYFPLSLFTSPKCPNYEYGPRFR